jgi:hypothetical protein
VPSGWEQTEDAGSCGTVRSSRSSQPHLKLSRQATGTPIHPCCDVRDMHSLFWKAAMSILHPTWASIAGGEAGRCDEQQVYRLGGRRMYLRHQSAGVTGGSEWDATMARQPAAKSSKIRMRCSRVQRPLIRPVARGGGQRHGQRARPREGTAWLDWRGVAVERGIIGGPLGLGFLS